jgi:hypothetical protein
MDGSNNLYNINMSPLLSKRFEEHEKNILELKESVNKINIQTESNTKLLEECLLILQENRKIYLEALNKIQQTEDKEIKPLISKLTTNMYMPTYEQRLLNRVWRTKDSNLTIPEIHTSSGFLNIQAQLKK